MNFNDILNTLKPVTSIIPVDKINTVISSTGVPTTITIPSGLLDIFKNTPLEKYIPSSGSINLMNPTDFINQGISSATIDAVGVQNWFETDFVNFFNINGLSTDFQALIIKLAEFSGISLGIYLIYKLNVKN